MIDFHTLLPSRTLRDAQVDWIEEQRKDRVGWLVFAGGLPFIALAIFHQTLITIMVLQGYFLTSMEFGLVFFVAERKNIRRPWIWKALVASILLHVAVLVAIFSWDRRYPELAVKGAVLTGVLLVAGLVELYLMLLIVEMCKPFDEEGRPPRKSGAGGQPFL
jgi:hypothetical protein